jgi:hypothetical protein
MEGGNRDVLSAVDGQRYGITLDIAGDGRALIGTVFKGAGAEFDKWVSGRQDDAVPPATANGSANNGGEFTVSPDSKTIQRNATEVKEYTAIIDVLKDGRASVRTAYAGVSEKHRGARVELTSPPTISGLSAGHPDNEAKFKKWLADSQGAPRRTGLARNGYRNSLAPSAKPIIERVAATGEEVKPEAQS